MPLKYALYKNPFRKKEYMATVRPDGIATLKNVLEDMAQMSRRYSVGELDDIFSLFLKAVDYQLKNGNHVHLPFLKITTSISGKFTNDQDRFDARRHQVNVKVNPGKQLTQIAAAIKVKKVAPSCPTPWIRSVHDFTQSESGRVLTLGGPAEIRGKHLKIDESDPRQGLFLVSADHEKVSSEIRIMQLYQNMATRVLFQVPAEVPPGAYHLKIKAMVGNSTQVRQNYSSRPLQVGSCAACE